MADSAPCVGELAKVELTVEKPSALHHKAYTSVEQAINLFEAEVSQLRESWVYDWIIPLVLADIEEVGELQYRIHSLHRIRSTLNDLQAKMVTCIYMSLIDL
jgi:hypothetical protein